MTVTTTDNGIPKQGLGDNLNSWGIDSSDGLNQAISLLEKLASGVETISLTGDKTLTTTAKTDNEARNIGFYFTDGGLSAAPTVTVPSIEGVYLCYNAGSTYTITVSCSGSSTTASVPPGAMIPVISDGTDCFGGIFRLDQLSAPTSSVSMGSQKITSLATGTASTDAVNVSQMNTAIASAGVPASTGAVLVSANDTTAQYLNGALVAGSGITLTENNDGADETLTLAVDTTVIMPKSGGSFTGAVDMNGNELVTDVSQFATTDAGNSGTSTHTVAKTSLDFQSITATGDFTINVTAPDTGQILSKRRRVTMDATGARDITVQRQGGSSNIYWPQNTADTTVALDTTAYGAGAIFDLWFEDDGTVLTVHYELVKAGS